MFSKAVQNVFMPHGLGHFVGLDVHDTSDSPITSSTILEQNMVLTIEPGCYFNEAVLANAINNPNLVQYLNVEKLNNFDNFGGVRIEDVFLIAERFAIQLSDAPKEIADIEKIQHRSL